MLLTLQAHAKINLALAVGPAQPPRGYHPICSWFAPVELHDTLTLQRLPPGRGSHYVIAWAHDAARPSVIDWATEKDLAVRAHALLEAEFGPLPLELRVSKRIPAGGGLGGGSSDAASTLVGLNRLFELGLSPRRLRELSVSLGSDVAFFIDDEAAEAGGPASGGAVVPPAVVTGLGETLRRVGRVEGEVLLIFPSFGCATGPVYQAFDRAPVAALDRHRVEALVAQSLAAGRIDADRLFNDLLPPARQVEPRLGELLDRLDAIARRSGRRVHMTGSGSTLFVLLAEGKPGSDTAEALAHAAADADCATVRTRLV